MVNKQEPPKVRPVTVKVKQGKFRLDLSASNPKPSGKVKKKTSDMKDVKAAVDAKKMPLNKTTSGNGALKLPLAAKSSAPVTTPSVTSPSAHVLKVR